MIRLEKLRNIILSKTFRQLCGFVLLISIAIYVFKNKNLFSNILSISLFYLFLLAIVWICIYLITGYQTKIFLRIFNIKTSPREWFGTTVIATMSNYLLPHSGIVARGGYFKLKKQMSLCDFLAVQSAEYFLMFMIKGLLGFSCAFFLLVEPKYKFTLSLIFLVFVFIGLIPFLLRIFKINSSSWIMDKIRNVVLGIELISKSHSAYIGLIILSLVSSFGYALWYFFGYKAIGIHMSFFNAFVLGLLMKVIMVVSITPGNLGIQEVAIATYSIVGKVGFDKGLAMSLVLRGISIPMSFLLGLIFTKKLFDVYSCDKPI